MIIFQKFFFVTTAAASVFLRKRTVAIQKIYDRLKLVEVSENGHMDNSHISFFLEEMNTITLEDVGIRKAYLDAIRFPQCMNIVSTPRFDISVFLLPKGSTLPLHDHPSMTVITKIVSGEAQIKGFTKISTRDISGSNSKDLEVSLHLDELKTCKDAAWYLDPVVGNFHEITALETCVMFDILAPPYIEPRRPCNFYFLERDEIDTETCLLRRIVDDSKIVLPYSVRYYGYKPV